MNKFFLCFIVLVFSQLLRADTLSDLCTVLDGLSPSRDFSAKIAIGCVKGAFVTSQFYDGNLGGVAGADAKCQSAANAGGLPGKFKAWIDDDGTAPDITTRFRQASTTYVAISSNTIANDWSDLTSGTLRNHIDRTELNVTAPSNVSTDIWTGALSDGTNNIVTSNTAHCSNWTSNSSGQTGSFGDFTTTSSAWSYASTGTCDTPRRLYCFQQ